MLVKRVKLHNIRSYSDEVIDFPEGSLLLSGDIGSGKSTILLAVEFALFGADSDRLSGNALLRKGTEEAEVEMTFEVQGEQITIKRGLKKARGVVAQTSGWILRDGKRKDGMPVELKSDVMALLGYPEELATKKKNLVYCYTVYCPQEEMKVILSDDKESRLDTLRKIFGIDKYKRVRENCAVVIRELKVRQREMEARILSLEQLKKQQEENKKSFDAASAEGVRLEAALGEIRTKVLVQRDALHRSEQNVRLLQEKSKRRDVIAAQAALKKDLLVKNETKMKQMGDIVEKYAPLGDYRDIELRVRKLEDDFHARSTKLSMLKQDMSHSQARCAELLREIEVDSNLDAVGKKARVQELSFKIAQKDSIMKRKEDIDTDILKFRAGLKEYEVKKSQADETRHKILSLATCPVCLQSVSKEHKARVCDGQNENAAVFEKKMQEYAELVRVKEKEVVELRKTLDALGETERMFFTLTAELRHVESRLKDVDGKKTMLAELEKKVAVIGAELELYASFDATAILGDVRKQKEMLENAKECARSRQFLEELTGAQHQLAVEVDVLGKDALALSKEIEELKPFEEQFRKIQEGLDGLTAEERTLSIQYAKLSAERGELERRIAHLDSEIVLMEEIKKKIGSIGQLRHWLEEYFVHLMETIEKHVMLKIYHEFNDFFRTWFSMLIADDGMAARVDDSFNPIIEQNGYEIDSAYLSGGERTSVALSYRLALNKVVNDIIHTIKTKELLILDEPTDGFSSEQLDRVRDVLRQLQVKQVILVSHENKMESFVDTVVKIGKEDGIVYGFVVALLIYALLY
jgi:exonuclease SbcC